MVKVKWALKKDYGAMVEMDPTVLSMSELVKELKNPNTIAAVATYEDIVVGYVIYTVHKEFIEIIGFMVHPDYRYNNVGTDMMAYMSTKLKKGKHTLKMQVEESNLDLQLFLKKMGLTASVNRGEEYYTFTYTLKDQHCQA